MAGLARFCGVVIKTCKGLVCQVNIPKRPVPWSLPPGGQYVESKVSES